MNKQDAIKKVETLEKELSELKAIINKSQILTDIIHSFEDAVKYTNFEIPMYWSHLPKHRLDQEKAEFVISVLNENHIFDWNNSSEYKYYCYWNMSSSGVGFSYHSYAHQYTHSALGSGLCLKSKELCQHIGNSPKLVELFKSFMLHKSKNQ